MSDLARDDKPTWSPHTLDTDSRETPVAALRPTAIPRFDVADYARRCDASILGSVIGAMPPLRDLALRARSSKHRGGSASAEHMRASFAVLVQTFVKKTG